MIIEATVLFMEFTAEKPNTAVVREIVKVKMMIICTIVDPCWVLPHQPKREWPIFSSAFAVGDA